MHLKHYMNENNTYRLWNVYANKCTISVHVRGRDVISCGEEAQVYTIHTVLLHTHQTDGISKIHLKWYDKAFMV